MGAPRDPVGNDQALKENPWRNYSDSVIYMLLLNNLNLYFALLGRQCSDLIVCKLSCND